MNRLKQHPVFFALMAVLIAVIAVEVAVVWSGRKRILAAQTAVRSTIGQLQQFKRRLVAPTEYNALLVRQDLEQDRDVLREMLKSLNAADSDEMVFFKGAPKTRTDAYFDIATFVENERHAASAAGVDIPADERFGFSDYANEGPDQPVMGEVYRQRRIIEYLLSMLFAAKPKALLFVQRENYQLPAAPKGSKAPPSTKPVPVPVPAASGKASGSPGDLFTVDPQVSARVPGFVDTLAFRVGFTGQTASLRSFMNQLVGSQLPLVVRSVEVEPSEPPAQRKAPPLRPAATPAGKESNSSGVPDLNTVEAARVPIVVDNVSRFYVTVEYLEIEIPVPPAANKGGRAP